jgi:hypothetical protein
MLDRLKIQACYTVGPIAQLVEQRTFNPWVDGSSPSGPTVRLKFLTSQLFIEFRTKKGAQP